LKKFIVGLGLEVWNDPLVVGIDLHEYEPAWLPYNVAARMPYLHGTFQGARKGLRVHAGEGVDTTNEMLALVMYLGNRPAGSIKCRIGHGTGIGRLLRYQNVPSSAWVLNQFEPLIRERFPIEVNLTSNKVLLDMQYNDHPLGSFVKRGWPVVLGTDDPGVFGVTLRSEFEAAIRNGHITSKDELRKIIADSIYFSFADDDLKRQLAKKLAAGIKKAGG